MNKLADYTKEEKSLLLFFETAAVDYAGKLNPAHMNKEDFEIAKKWKKEKFIVFERVAAAYLPTEKCYAVFLSDEAFAIAHEERKARSIRMHENKKWLTVSEYRLLPFE